MKKLIPYIVGGVIGAGIAVGVEAVIPAAKTNPKCIQYIGDGGWSGGTCWVLDDGSLWEMRTISGNGREYRQKLPPIFNGGKPTQFFW